MSAVERKPVTAAELLALPDDGRRWELVEGRLVEMAPAGGEHGAVSADLLTAINGYARPRGLGRAFAVETGFWLSRNPDSVRAPDVAFITAERCPDPPAQGYLEVVPDLVVEVVSPSDSGRYAADKAAVWLEAGVREVWLVWPRSRRVVVYRGLDDVATLGEDDTLTSEDLLPGFALPVRQVFA